MPIPQKGQSKENFIKICIPELIKEGKSQEQAAAQCNSVWEKSVKLKTVTVDGFESPAFSEDLPQKGIDILGSTYASCRLKWAQAHPDDRDNEDNKTSCSKIAWSAVAKAGFKTKLKMDTAELLNVEILKQGAFTDMNGRRVIVDDKLMKKLQENFNEGVGEPVITINHNKNETEDANSFMKSSNLGLISKLKQIGKSIFADFKKVPKFLAELIDSGRLIFRSAEWSPVFQSGDGRMLNNVLTGVTFHGGADGASAVSGLSNDFEAIGLKFTTEQQGDETISIDFKNLNDGNKEGAKMAKIEIDKSEYDELQKANDSVKDVQNENIELKKQAGEKEKLAEEDKKKIDDENVELKKYKEEKEKEAEVSLKKDAGEFADKLIKGEKLKPADKDDIVDDYIRLKAGDDEDKFNRFTKRLEDADKIINLGQITKDAAGNEIPNVDVKLKSNDGDAGNEVKDLGKSTDDIEEQIQLKMKQKGIPWKEAAVELGVINESELTTKLKDGGGK